jgi:hypothetical protein
MMMTLNKIVPDTPDTKIVKNERFDANAIEQLLIHDGVCKDTKKQLKAYKRRRVNGNTVQVVYEYGKKLRAARIGRLYPQSGLGLQCFPSDIRAFLAQKYYWDVDMVNSQPVILAQLAEKNGWKCERLKEYVEKRSEKLEEIMKMLDCDRSEAKTMCISVMFGGRFKKAPDFILELQDELLQVGQNLISTHPEIKKVLKGEDAKTMVAHILQHHEFRILQFIDAKLQVDERSMDTYIHDGGLVNRLPNENEFPSDLLRRLEEEVKKELGYSIRLEVKPLTHTFMVKEEKRRFIRNDKEAVDLLYNEMKDDVIYADNTFYYRNDLMWTSDITLIDSLVRQRVMEANIWKIDGDNERPYSTEFRHSTNLVKLIKEQTMLHKDDEWIVGVGLANKGKLLFSNGYYDMTCGRFFRPHDPQYDTSIVFLESIPYGWNPELLDEVYLQSIMEHFFLQQHDKVRGEFLALTLARGIAGDAMKHFAIGTGSGNTGKSFLAKTMGIVFGGYVGTFNGANLIYNPSSSQDEAQRNRWIGLLQNKRVVFSSELRMDKNALDGNVMKTLSSGGHDKIVCRGHAQNERDTPWRALCFLLANDMGRIYPVDEPLMKRILYFPYEKQYVEDVDEKNPYQLQIDHELESEVMTLAFKMNYAWLLFKTYHKWTIGGRKEIVPEDVRAGSKELVGETCPVKRFLDYGYIITRDMEDYVTSSTIQRWINDERVGISMMKFGREMKKYLILNNITGVKNDGKKVGGKNVQCWFGVKESV